MATTEVERHAGVDITAVPSAQWGWSAINHRTWQIAGAGAVTFLLLMLRGNHIGHIEDVFLFIFAALSTVFLVRDIVGRRRGSLR